MNILGTLVWGLKSLGSFQRGGKQSLPLLLPEVPAATVTAVEVMAEVLSSMTGLRRATAKAKPLELIGPVPTMLELLE